MIESIKEIFNSSPQNESLYLVSKLTSNSGFFSNNGKLLYIVKNYEELVYESIDTEFISLSTHVNIVAVENHTQFENGYYNILVYKGEPNGTMFDGFIRLCITYCNSTIKFGFVKFFYSLVDLFQLPKEQEFKNLLGLYGELKFIEYTFTKFHCDLSFKWHNQNGALDKYDFVCIESNFEIKTIMAEETIVKIKHKQIFNSDNNYLIIVKIQKDNSGRTLNNLINDLRNIEPFSNNYEFQLKLECEKKRVSIHDADTIRFKLVDIEAYNVSNLETIEDIPECITDLNYKYNFSGIKSEKLNKSMFI